MNAEDYMHNVRHKEAEGGSDLPYDRRFPTSTAPRYSTHEDVHHNLKHQAAFLSSVA